MQIDLYRRRKEKGREEGIRRKICVKREEYTKGRQKEKKQHEGGKYE